MASLTKVSDASLTAKLAGAISGIMRENGSVQIQAVGANSVSQVEKALTLARKYLRANNIDIFYFSDFVDIKIEGKAYTAIRFTVERR